VDIQGGHLNSFLNSEIINLYFSLIKEGEGEEEGGV